MMKHIWWLNKLKKSLKRCFKTENASALKTDFQYMNEIIKSTTPRWGGAFDF